MAEKKKDLSTMEVALKLDSPMFECFVRELNVAIKRGLMKVNSEEFEEATVTAKIKIDLPTYEEPQQVRDEFTGETVTRMRQYKVPHIDHEITVNLNQKTKTTGNFILKEHEIMEIEGEFIAIPIAQAQMSMDEFVKEMGLDRD